MAKKLVPIQYDAPIPKDPRGRKPRKVLSPDEVGKLVSVMNPLSFIQIPKEYKSAIGKPPVPVRNETYEDIFYRSLKENEITTKEKWIDFIYGSRDFLKDDTQMPIILRMLGLPPYASKVVNMLADCEIQRWWEMYYVAMVQKNGRCGSNYPGYDPTIANAIAAKYGIVNIPCAEDNHIATVEPAIPKAGRGRPVGGTKIDQQKIEELRISLMKCKIPTAIAKEFGVSDKTIFNNIKSNEFIGSKDFKKTIALHTESIMRLIARGDTPWDYYVRIRAICEKALMKSVYAADPSFVMRYQVCPTKPSLVYEYNKVSGSVLRLSQTFGVSEKEVRMWLDKYQMGRVQPTTAVPIASTERHGGVIDDDMWSRLGIDPNYKQGGTKFDRDMYR